MSDDSIEKLYQEMLASTRQWRELYRTQQELIVGLNLYSRQISITSTVTA